jgi:hypothetical protein
MVWAQASRSIAVSAQTSHAALMLNWREGNRPSPVSLAHLILSSTRAWERWRASSQACWPATVSVAKQV